MTTSKQQKKLLSLKRKLLRQENSKYPINFVEVPPNLWPQQTEKPDGISAVYRSNKFLVQVFPVTEEIDRLTICRTELNSAGKWKDGITWEELQEIKNELGYSSCDAVEVYPSLCDEVTAANMRHLWVFTASKLPFVWRKAHLTGQNWPGERHD